MLNWYILGSIAVTSGLLNAVLSYMIMHYLSVNGVKVNYWAARLYMLKYLSQYRKMTSEKQGSPGNLYYAWLITIGLLFISAIGLIITLLPGK